MEDNMKEVIEEIKNADEESLRKVIENWFESTRTSGMKIGAQYISAGIFGIIQKHIKKKAKPSLRDYQRCMDEIIQVISVQLTKQNDSEETNDDGTTEDAN
jgi:O-acetyl-ADP-ribose deacetylase (regulator of RNase III)